MSPNDAHALNTFYERFCRPIHSCAYRLLGSQEDADDITQEVFVRLFTAWDGLHDRDNLSTWLYRLATNVSIDLLRRRKRLSWRSLTPRKRDDAHDGDTLSDERFFLPPDDGGIPEIAEREHIRLAIAHMPEEYAVVLVLNVAEASALPGGSGHGWYLAKRRCDAYFACEEAVSRTLSTDQSDFLKSRREAG